MESKTLANVNSAFDLESLEPVDGIEVIEHFKDIENLLLVLNELSCQIFRVKVF